MNNSCIHKFWNRVLYIVIGAAILQASIAGSIFVRCITADGQGMIELAGEDPHRHDHSAFDCAPASTSGALHTPCCYVHARDCVDLLLDNSAVPVSGTNRLLPESAANTAADSIRAITEAGAYRSLRDSVDAYSPHIKLRLPLRI